MLESLKQGALENLKVNCPAVMPIDTHVVVCAILTKFQ